MPRFAWVMVVVLCLVAQSAWAAPRVMVPENSFDFGKISQGETVRHAFTFSNAGDAPLTVEKVRSSCGCTAVLATAKSLAPGESGEIQANFDSARFRGAITKTIYLYTNDAYTPVMQLYIKGNVLEVVTAEPAKVDLGRVVPGEAVDATVVLRNQGKETLTLERPSTTAPELVALIGAPELRAGETTSIKVRLTAKPGRSRFSGYVLINAQGTSTRQLRIPVYATLN